MQPVNLPSYIITHELEQVSQLVWKLNPKQKFKYKYGSYTVDRGGKENGRECIN